MLVVRCLWNMSVFYKCVPFNDKKKILNAWKVHSGIMELWI